MPISVKTRCRLLFAVVAGSANHGGCGVFASTTADKVRKFRPAMILVTALLLLRAGDCFSGQDPMIAGSAEKLSVRLGYIIDGDSIMVKKDKRPIEIRLYGIDAPEFDQPGSSASRRALAKLVEKGELLSLQIMDRDHYGRLVAIVHAGKININEELVRSGQAWVYARYCRIALCDDWLMLEKKARQDKAGLWRQQNPVAPWRWKAANRRRK